MKINPHNCIPSYDRSNRHSFDKAIINAARTRSSGNSAAIVTVSLEALAQAEAKIASKASPSGTKMLLNYIRPWYDEVFAEAHKNGTSFEEAMKEHGMKIAEFIAGEAMKMEAFFSLFFPEKYLEKFPDGTNQEFLDELKAFLDGTASRINGESLKDAFKDYDIEKAMEEWGPALDMAHMSRHEYFDKDSNRKIVGYYSHRYERFVYAPEPNEEINKDVPQKEYSNNAIQQEKSAILKDFGERMIASLCQNI
jgi:hypothetical protein